MRNESDTETAEVFDLLLSKIAEILDDLREARSETEIAANTILQHAETVMEDDNSGNPARESNDDRIQQQMINIIVACGFQDVVGQRIGRISDTVQVLKSRLTSAKTLEALPKHLKTESAVERHSAERARKLLVSGPEHTTSRKNQDEIDALFGD